MAEVDQFELYLIRYQFCVQMKILQNENKNLEQDEIKICRSCILCLLDLRGVCADKYLGDSSRKFLGFFWILHNVSFMKLLRACQTCVSKYEVWIHES